MATILPTAIAFVAIVSVASMLRADILTSEQKNFYRQNNTAMDSLQINDESGLDVDAAGNNITLATLFNGFFSTEYVTSQDLFDDIGVKEVVENWRVNDNARIEASFKSAALGQALGIVDSLGGVHATQLFVGGTSSGLGGEAIYFDVSGLYNFTLTADGNVFSGAAPGSDGLLHMIAFDVTALMQSLYPDQNIESAYLFSWEDLPLENWYYDTDYQDLAYIMVNVSPVLTPEPSTLFIIGIAGVSVLLLRKRTAVPTQSKP